METWFEDMIVGRVDRYGAKQVMREEVLDFAGKYDPQPFHLDDAAAAANPLFGRLAASGWHTAAMAMRLTVDRNAAIGAQVLGGAGIDRLDWLRPVYPGDVLRCEQEVIAARPSASRPAAGVVTLRTTVFNQEDVAVMRQTVSILARRKPADAPA